MQKRRLGQSLGKALIERDPDLRRKFLSHLMNHKSTMEQLSNKFGKHPDEILECIKVLRGEGTAVAATRLRSSQEVAYYMNLVPDAYNIYRISGQDSKDRYMDFGFVSYPDISGEFSSSGPFHRTMSRLEDQGISRVYVAGGVLEGADIHRNRYENSIPWSVEEQTERAAEAFQRHPGLEFWGISGGRDRSFRREEMVEPLAMLEKKADNFRNLGDLRAEIIYHGIKIRLLRGDATSHPAEIYVHDYVQGIEQHALVDEPHVLLLGRSRDRQCVISFQPGGFREHFARQGMAGAFYVQMRYQDALIREFSISYIHPETLRENGVAFAGTADC